MKRCPQCNHIPTNDKLSFCRIDGARLVQHSGSFSNSETLELPLDAPQASANGEILKSPVAATSAINSPEATSITSFLLRMNKKPISLVVIAMVAATLMGSAYYSLSRKRNACISLLAVLPFIDVNADQQLEYLSDGMTDMLICNLSRLPKLSVKAHSSVFRYKDSNIAPNKVGHDLNVQAVLNGRIVLRGDLLMLSLELADVSTEDVIWSGQYVRKQGDIASLQSEIARDIYDKLSMKLGGIRADPSESGQRLPGNRDEPRCCFIYRCPAEVSDKKQRRDLICAESPAVLDNVARNHAGDLHKQHTDFDCSVGASIAGLRIHS